MVYLRNNDMLRELRLSKAAGRPTPEFIQQFVLLSDRAACRLRYRDPDDAYDCKAQAMEDFLRYWDRFDESKGTNCFAFYTSLFKNGAAKGWGKLHNPNMKTVSLTALNNLEQYFPED